VFICFAGGSCHLRYLQLVLTLSAGFSIIIDLVLTLVTLKVSPIVGNVSDMRPSEQAG